jgi:excisionase family DNA binding protein
MSTYFNESVDPQDWVSQAEAARIRGVSRQAIAKLVRGGRIRTLEIGGNILVHREDIALYKPLLSGRPKKDG